MNQDQDADTRSPLTPLVKVLCKEIDMFLLFALNSLKQHSVLTTKRLWSVIDDLELQHENDLKDWDIFSLMLASTIIPEKNATSVELAESDKPLSPIQQQQEIELVPIQQQEEEIETLSTPLADLPAQHLSSHGDNVIQKEDVNIGVTTRPSLLEWDPFFGQKTLPIPFPRSAAADTSNYDDLKDPFPALTEEKNCCKACDKKCKNKRSYAHHLSKAHNMSFFSYGKFQPINAKYYCKWCDEGYDVLEVYRQHLIMVHKVVQITKSATDPTSSKILNPDLVPDMSDPYYYCKACEVTLFNNSAFKKHLLKIHGIVSVIKKVPKAKTLKSSPIKPDFNNLDSYCTMCDKKIAKPRFRWHLLYQHNALHPAIHEDLINYDERQDYSIMYENEEEEEE